jgi:hypothetical protein
LLPILLKITNFMKKNNLIIITVTAILTIFVLITLVLTFDNKILGYITCSYQSIELSKDPIKAKMIENNQKNGSSCFKQYIIEGK